MGGLGAHMANNQVLAPEIARVEQARALMKDFALRTAVEAPTSQGARYLWTDAFAVANFLSIHRATGEPRFRDLALRLVAVVHDVLGRHRPDDARTGWISGLDERQGSQHPTAGGLRIGKKLPERKASVAPCARVDWDRDGQYFHYLTRWIHALVRVGEATGDSDYVRMAAELAETAHGAFCWIGPDGLQRIHWKMSIDLHQPVVTSMGQHDAIDGWIALREIKDADRRMSRSWWHPGLDTALLELRSIVASASLPTDDPLGLGGLLCHAAALAQWSVRASGADAENLRIVLSAAHRSMQLMMRSGAFEQQARFRLPFRELGLAIGLRGLRHVRIAMDSNSLPKPSAQRIRPLLEGLEQHVGLAQVLIDTWLDPQHQESRAFTEHRNINSVMLATALLPDIHLRV
jgi:hypothetical protein